MQIRKILVLIMFGLMSIQATAEFRTVMEVHEVYLVNVRLPGTESGTLTFSLCEKCELFTLRVTPATRYVVNGQTVTLVDFRKAVRGIRNRNEQMVDVFHELATNTATTVRVKI